MTTDEIRAYFEAKGISQREVARFIGVDTRTVRRWFVGDPPPPRLFELAIEADIFDTEKYTTRTANKLVLRRKNERNDQPRD
jgi:transcriptional regulator with XRE-family HTH domain